MMAAAWVWLLWSECGLAGCVPSGLAVLGTASVRPPVPAVAAAAWYLGPRMSLGPLVSLDAAGGQWWQRGGNRRNATLTRLPPSRCDMGAALLE